MAAFDWRVLSVPLHGLHVIVIHGCKNMCGLIALWLNPAGHCFAKLVRKTMSDNSLASDKCAPASNSATGTTAMKQVFVACRKDLAYAWELQSSSITCSAHGIQRKWFVPGVADVVTEVYGSTARKHKPLLMLTHVFSVFVSIGNYLDQPGDAPWCAGYPFSNWLIYWKRYQIELEIGAKVGIVKQMMSASCAGSACELVHIHYAKIKLTDGLLGEDVFK